MVWITAAWGACFVLIEAGLAEAPVLWFATLRSLIAGVALLGYALLRNLPMRPAAPTTPRLWVGVAAFGFFNSTLGFGFMFAGVAGASAGVAAVLANAQPLLILLPAHWWFGEPARMRSALALSVGLVGLLIMTGPAGGGSGAWLSLSAAAAITAGTLFARRLQGTNAVAVVAWNFIIGGAALAAVAAIFEGQPAIAWTPTFTILMAFLALVGTAAAFVAWFEEVQRVPLATLSAWTFLVPVFGLALGVLIGGDRPNAWTGIGLTLIVVSLWVTTRTSGRRATESGSTGRCPRPDGPSRSRG